MAIGRPTQRNAFNDTGATPPPTQSEWREWQTSD
jgi:hypothetical protein